jgi:hypothetical protein
MARQTQRAPHLAFETALKAAALNRYVVRSRMTLGEICAISRITPRYPVKLLSEAVDFVLCDPATLAPLVAIDLDDARHFVRDHSVRESVIDDVFRGIGVALIRPRAQTTYDAGAIAQWIEAAMSRAVAKNSMRTTERPAP